eukprot:TRINITY_DN878_c1_g3_i1.p1 TRINITY_DN878_c1_g3~~TRINITY_DN878_c1_g3_i1.p1  ORF type:complete len:648 (+),score=134.06 TRINITY_DN878_c1_g3_i1:128-2071(+)
MAQAASHTQASTRASSPGSAVVSAVLPDETGSFATESTFEGPAAAGVEVDAGRDARIPVAGLMLVEFPGMIRDNPASQQKALDMLGGGGAAAAAYSGDDALPRLLFRDPQSRPQPTFGKVSSTSHLHVRVRVRTKKSAIKRAREETESVPLKNARITTRLLGVVRKTLKFRNLCDLQYVPPPGLVLPVPGTDDITPLREFVTAATSGGDALRNMPVQPLFLPPKLWSRVDVPQDYGYQDNPASTLVKEIDQDGNEVSCQRVISSTYSAPNLIKKDWQDLSVPTGPTNLAKQAVRPGSRAESCLPKLHEMFRRRPVWSRTSITTVLCPESADVAHLLRLVLPVVAYTYTTGPYRQLYLRFGYDPRKWTLNVKPGQSEEAALLESASFEAQGDDIHPALLSLMDLRLGRLQSLREVRYTPQRIDKGTPLRVAGPTRMGKRWPKPDDPLNWDRLPLSFEKLFWLYSSTPGRSGMLPRLGTIFMQYVDLEDMGLRKKVVESALKKLPRGASWLPDEKVKSLRRDIQAKYREFHNTLQQRSREESRSTGGGSSDRGPSLSTGADTGGLSDRTGRATAGGPSSGEDDDGGAAVDAADDEEAEESDGDGMDAAGMEDEDSGDSLLDAGQEEEEPEADEVMDEEEDIFDTGLLDD